MLVTDVKIGAYFYPITTRCPERARRARLLGAATIDEHELTRSAQPLYPGPKQPRRYCLGDSPITYWGDSNPNTMARQIEVEEQYGIVCAWNEIAEGCALLPQVTSAGEVDFGYLEMVKRIADGEELHAG